MNRDLGPRLKRLEAEFSHLTHRPKEVRVAGKSRSDFWAEVLADMFLLLEPDMPECATAFVEEAMHGGEEAGDDPILGMILAAERQNPGLPHRILDAVLSGAEAITEEMLFPDGRPLSEETYNARHGKRFCYRLDGAR